MIVVSRRSGTPLFTLLLSMVTQSGRARLSTSPVARLPRLSAQPPARVRVGARRRRRHRAHAHSQCQQLSILLLLLLLCAIETRAHLTPLTDDSSSRFRSTCALDATHSRRMSIVRGAHPVDLSKFARHFVPSLCVSLRSPLATTSGSRPCAKSLVAASTGCRHTTGTVDS